MPLPALTTPVPHSVGLNRPQRLLPPGACDSHMHIFDARFAPSAHWPRTPPDAPVAAYWQLQQRLGSTRTVVVTPSTYGTDNACTLDALDQLGDSARGVAVVDHGVSDAELARLAARRVCGLRVNFVSPQSWGTTTPDMLATVARQVADHPACTGWHIQIFAHPEQLIALAPQLHTLPVPLVIDHLGRIDPAEGPAAEAYGVVRGHVGSRDRRRIGFFIHRHIGAPMRQCCRASLAHQFNHSGDQRMAHGLKIPR